MSINAFYNGIYCNKKDVKISLFDRAVFFGDGIYDAAIGRNGKVFMLDEHIERFLNNAKAVGIPFSQGEKELREILLRLTSVSKSECYFLYFQLSRYSKERSHSYEETSKSNLLVTITPIEIPKQTKALSLTIAEDLRHHFCNIKTLNLLPAVLASHAAEKSHFDETVLVRDGIVTECAHSNVHIVKNSELITHPLDNLILPGISRMHLLSVCKREGIKVSERKFGIEELFNADEVIVTSTSKLAMRVKRVESVVFNLQENSIADRLCRIVHEEFVSFTNK